MPGSACTAEPSGYAQIGKIGLRCDRIKNHGRRENVKCNAITGDENVGSMLDPGLLPTRKKMVEYRLQAAFEKTLSFWDCLLNAPYRATQTSLLPLQTPRSGKFTMLIYCARTARTPAGWKVHNSQVDFLIIFTLHRIVRRNHKTVLAESKDERKV